MGSQSVASVPATPSAAATPTPGQSSVLMTDALQQTLNKQKENLQTKIQEIHTYIKTNPNAPDVCAFA